MAFKANAIVVLVASPGDTAPERDAIQLVLNGWNVNRGEREGIVLIPYLYEQHAIPVMGGHPQSLLNKQAVDRADVVVAFFDAKLGTETAEAVSGTAEEIIKANDAGKPVHIYFSDEPIPRGTDLEQLRKLEEFKTTLRDKALYASYEDPKDLASKVIQAIDYDISTQSWALKTTASGTSGADLKMWHENRREQSGTDNKGRPKYRTLVNDLVVRNDGNRTAEGITLEIVGESPGLFEAPEPFDLTPTSESQFNMIALHSGNAVVKASWTEGGESKEVTRTVRVPGR